jgi:hypothetical protein
LEEIRCRICDSALYIASSFVGRPSRDGLPVRSEVQIETDGTSQYFKCPHCSARNITIVTTAHDGRPGLQVAWAVMNGD